MILCSYLVWKFSDAHHTHYLMSKLRYFDLFCVVISCAGSLLYHYLVLEFSHSVRFLGVKTQLFCVVIRCGNTVVLCSY